MTAKSQISRGEIHVVDAGWWRMKSQHHYGGPGQNTGESNAKQERERAVKF